MTDTLSVSWDIPEAVKDTLPARLTETAEECYSNLFFLIWHRNRCRAGLFFTSCAFMAIFSLAILQWKAAFSFLSLLETCIILVMLGLTGALLGWKVGGMKNRFKVAEVRKKMIASLHRDEDSAEAMSHIRDRDPRPEYRTLVGQLFTETNEGFVEEDGS